MRAAFACLLLVACGKGKDSAPPPPQTLDAGGFVHPPIDSRVVDVPDADWAACKTALAAAPKASAMRRLQTLLAACKPCGDWKPLLDWSKEPDKGGPTRTQIEDSMIACKAYCNPDAKQRFLGTLDKFRGKDTRGPWRFLGDVCKERVSAVPDNRYLSAPFFALDRIARAAGERPELLPLLDAIELPLPVVSVSGYGYELAKSPVTAPDVGPLALTVTPSEIRIAVVPHAKLSKDGVTTLTKGESYPGVLIKTAKELDDAIAKLGEPINASTKIAIFAPHAMVATRLLDALAITGERPRPVANKPPKTPAGDVRLAVQADGGPPGWQISGSVPVALRTTPLPDSIHVDLDDNPDPVIEQLKTDKAKLMAVATKHKPAAGDPSAQLLQPTLAIHLGPKATVGGLAKLVGAAVYFDVKAVALIRGATKAGGSTK